MENETAIRVPCGDAKAEEVLEIVRNILEEHGIQLSLLIVRSKTAWDAANTTEILAALEARFPGVTVHPGDPESGFKPYTAG